MGANSSIPTIYWKDKTLAKITNLSLVSNSKLQNWELKSCVGITKLGEEVNVSLPFDQLDKRNIKKQIVEFARDENVFAKGLDIFQSIYTRLSD